MTQCLNILNVNYLIRMTLLKAKQDCLIIKFDSNLVFFFLKECEDKVSNSGVHVNEEFSRHHHQRPRSKKIDSNPDTGVRLNR